METVHPRPSAPPQSSPALRGGREDARGRLAAILGAAALVVLCAVCWMAYRLSFARAAEAKRRTSAQNIEFLARSLGTLLGQYEQLPYLAGLDQDVVAALLNPGDRAAVAAANAYLVAVRERTGVDTVYIIQPSGDCIAASNWRTAKSFVGTNYSFRPYFKDALAGGTGHYFAIGAVSGEPGYFLSGPVRRDGRMVGVSVVKVLLQLPPSEDPVAVVDQEGVIFLSTVPEWRYRALAALRPGVVERLRDEKRYADQPLEPLVPGKEIREAPHLQRLRLFSGASVQRSAEDYIVQFQPFGPNGWRMFTVSGLRDARRVAIGTAVATGFGVALLFALTAIAYQRRLRRDERRMAEAKLAASEEATRLKMKYADELAAKNQELAAAERALREEHTFRIAMENSVVTGMRAVDMEGRIIYANPAFCKMVGYSAQELIGALPPYPYWPPEEREHIDSLLKEAHAPDSPGHGIELKLMRRGGERFDVLLYEAPLVDAEGHQSGWMGSLLDITERKRARELARQQEEKLAATARLVMMGEMASAIAHELNQPLSAIASYTTGCLNVLKNGEPPKSELTVALGKAADQALRAGHIIRRVYEFVRKSEPTKSIVRINAMVEEAVTFVESEARRRRVKLRSHLFEGDPELQADPVMLQQTLLNLLYNGMDAMVETPIERREIVIATGLEEESVVVSVADRGCGIPEEIEQKLFEPFFTTKPEGMGMGLNICRSVVELHKGRLWTAPNPGGGTVFSFSLPVEAT